MLHNMVIQVECRDCDARTDVELLPTAEGHIKIGSGMLWDKGWVTVRHPADKWDYALCPDCTEEAKKSNSPFGLDPE